MYNVLRDPYLDVRAGVSGGAKWPIFDHKQKVSATVNRTAASQNLAAEMAWAAWHEVERPRNIDLLSPVELGCTRRFTRTALPTDYEDMHVYDGIAETVRLCGDQEMSIPLDVVQPLLGESAVHMWKMASEARSLFVGNQLQTWWQDGRLLALHSTGPIGESTPSRELH
eukprot:evm.model.scf_629EXC.4 EVM.evm.TU.scf_629EXC.4   scf_629EXC:34049-35536(-)